MIRWWILACLCASCAREPAYAEPERCIETDCGPVRADVDAAVLDDAGYLRGRP